MTSVAVVGAAGYVGSAVVEALAARDDVALTPVTRDSHAEARERRYDVVVNAAMPSRRFWARQHPALDFDETVRKTADLVYGWQYDKLVHISSISARSQLDTVYGRHKAAAERLVPTDTHLVVRLGPMFDEALAKGVLVDMLEGRTVFVAGESRYAFAPRAFVAGWIADHLADVGLVECGAHDAIALADVAHHLGASVTFDGPVDHQETQGATDGFPDARDVLDFLDAERHRRSAAPG